METFMKRRDFLERTAIAATASLLLGSVRSDGYRLIGSAFAADDGDDGNALTVQISLTPVRIIQKS
jgi:2-methylcitrate dehydratase